MSTTAKLIFTENTDSTGREFDPEFAFLVQQGILLSLHAEGILTLTQYRNGEQQLNTQRLEALRKQGRGASSL